MKKLVVLLMVFGMATVASAATLDVTASSPAAGQLLIQYQADVAPACIALSLVADGGATLDPATGVVSYDPCLPVHLDYAHDQAPAGWDPCDGPFYTIGDPAQTPVADAAGAGVPAAATGTFDICMGQVDTAPPTGVVRDLCLLQFDCTEAFDVTITASDLRGEVAGGPDGTTWTVNVPAAAVAVPCGGPVDCWLWDCQPNGDANGDCAIDTIDLYILVDAATASFSGEHCADFNHDGATDTIDLYTMVNAATASFNTCPAGCTPQ